MVTSPRQIRETDYFPNSKQDIASTNDVSCLEFVSILTESATFILRAEFLCFSLFGFLFSYQNQRCFARRVRLQYRNRRIIPKCHWHNKPNTITWSNIQFTSDHRRWHVLMFKQILSTSTIGNTWEQWRDFTCWYWGIKI